MKKHNVEKVVLVSLLVVLVLSWIIPSGYYSGEFIDQGRIQMGLSELFNYPLTVLSYFGHIVLFIILVGCFYGVLYKIPAYRTYLDWVVAKFEGKEIIFVGLTVVLLALGVSIAGLQIVFLLFVPLIVSLILLMGYDKIVAALTVVGGMSAGLIGSTYAYGNLSLLLQILSLNNDYQIGVRFVLLAVAVILVLFNIVVYVKKNKNGVVVLNSTKEEKKAEIVKEEVVEEVEEKAPVKTTKSNAKKGSKSSSKSGSKKNTKSNGSKKSSSKAGTNKSSRSKNPNKAALKQEDIIVVKENVSSDEREGHLVPERVDVTHKVWPFAVGFMLMFVLVVLAFITWGDEGFGVTLFDEVTNNVTEFELFGFPIFSKIYGSINSFGNWSVVDLYLPMALLIVLLSVIYKVKFSDVLDGIADGAKKAAAPALVALILYTVLVASTFHPFQLTVYKFIFGLAKSFNILTASIAGIISSMVNIDPAYVFQAALPYYTSLVTKTGVYGNVAVIFQSMYGFTSLFAPTSLVLMCVLSYLNVNYKDWLKSSWKLIVEVLAVLMIVFIILAL